MREARPDPQAVDLAALNADVLMRVLLGECQKSVAIDRGVSISTIAMLCASTLREMGCQRLVSQTPLVFVMAAFAADGLPLEAARILRVEPPFRSIFIIETPMPDLALERAWTPGERDIVRMLLEGRTYADVAAGRRRSIRTVANQVSSSYRKLGVSGRGELVARLVRNMSARETSTSKRGQPWLRRSPFDLTKIAANQLLALTR